MLVLRHLVFYFLKKSQIKNVRPYLYDLFLARDKKSHNKYHQQL